MAAGGSGGGSASAVRAGRCFVEAFLDDKKFKQGLTGMRATMLSFGNGLKLGGAAGLLIGGGITAALAVMGKQALDTGGQLQDMADRLGAPVEELNALGYAASLAGSGLEEVEAAVTKMQQAIAEGKNVGGLNLGSLLGQELPDQVDAIADAIAGIENPAQRTAFAMEIFGKAGRKMIPFLNDGADGMRRFRAEALLVTGTTKEQVELFDRVGDSISKMWTSAKSIGASIIEAAFGKAEDAESLSAAFVNIAAGIRAVVKNNGPLVQGLALTAGGILVVSTAAVAAGFVVTGLAAAIGGLGATLGFLFSPAGAAAIALGAIGSAGAYLIYAFTDVGTHFSKAWEGIVKAVKGGDLELAFKIAFKGVKAEFLELIKSMSEGVAAVAISATAGAVGTATGGPIVGGLAAASSAAGLLAANAAAKEGLAETKGELAALLAQANSKVRDVEKRVHKAAVEAMRIGGPTKGGFGTMDQLRQQLGVHDQVLNKQTDLLGKVATNTAATTDAVKRISMATWAA